MYWHMPLSAIDWHAISQNGYVQVVLLWSLPKLVGHEETRRLVVVFVPIFRCPVAILDIFWL